MRRAACLLVLLAACGEGRTRSGPTPPSERCTSAVSPLYSLKQDAVAGAAPELSSLAVTALTDEGYFVQLDPNGAGCSAELGLRFGGIFVFNGGDPKPALDSVVSLSGGQSALHEGQLQLQSPSWMRSGSRTTLPVRVVSSQLTQDARSPYEAVLVELTNIGVSGLDLENGVRIDAFAGYAPPASPANSTIARIAGVLAWRDGRLMLGPRSMSDVELQTVAPADAGVRDATSGDGSIDPGVLSIREVRFSPAELKPNVPVELTVIVEHTGGLERVSGAEVESGSFFSALVPVSSDSYRIQLDWSSFGDLDFGPGGTSRTLRIAVRDQHGMVVRSERSLDIGCPSSSDSACRGVCRDLSEDVDSCGSCGASCADWAEASGATWYDPKTLRCEAGTCRAGFAFDERRDCSTLCSGFGASCGPAIDWERCYNWIEGGFSTFNNPPRAEACASFGDRRAETGNCSWTPPQALDGTASFSNVSCACTAR